ncbi:hypothetical protein PIB30_029825, partial [Stylosanthes scabra]|nr:hypothetical protein [Stylosanthes scabra]
TGLSLKGWRSALSDPTRSSFSEDRVSRCVVRRTRDNALEFDIGHVSSVEPKLRRWASVVLRYWLNMSAAWLANIGVLQFLVSEQFSPYELEDGIVMLHSILWTKEESCERSYPW